MRFLLINSNRHRYPSPVMPSGLCAVASSLELAGHEVSLLDLCFAPDPASEIQGEIGRFRPDAIGIGVRNLDLGVGIGKTFLADDVATDVVAPCKAAFSGPIVLGGTAVGINGAELLDYFDLEYAVQGDGERTMVELARRLSLRGEWSGVPGLIVRKHGKLREDNPPDFIDDLDSLPWARPHRHLDLEPYRRFHAPFQVQTKRGCALTCSYCTYNRIEGHRYRLRSAKLVVDEIEEFVRETQIREVEFVDSTFNAPLGHAKAVLREIVARNLGLKLTTMGLNPGFMDDELGDLMKQAGFVEACFGAESGSRPMLAALGKSYTVDDIYNAARIMRRVRIPSMWFLIFGAPGETPETLRETVRTMRRAVSFFDLVNVGVGLRIYKGAPIADTWAQEHGGPPLDNFLKPLALVSPEMDIERLRAHALWATLRHHNFLSYDQQQGIRPELREWADKIRGGQPYWRLYIAVRLFRKFTGQLLIGTLRFWFRNRKQLAGTTRRRPRGA